MNGPDHYRAAETLLARSGTELSAIVNGGMRTPTDAELAVADLVVKSAEVHATLALAAATVADRGIGPEGLSGWRELHPSPDWQEVTS